MLIFNEHDQPVIIHNICGPTVAEYMWILDLSIMDYTLTSVTMLEETVCSSVKLLIKGFELIVPDSWNILIYDTETSHLDVIELAESAGQEFTALIMGPKKSFPSGGIITVVDYYTEYRNVNPTLNRHQMLCHPISKDEWITIAPSDMYGKYFKNATVGDLLAD